MKSKIGDILAVRINSYKSKGHEEYGSGVIYKTEDPSYDLIFTAKHCLCRKDSNYCKNNCDDCTNTDIAKTKIKIDNPSNGNLSENINVEDFYILEDRDFAVIKISKLSLKELITPYFTDRSQFLKIDGWGFPSINDSTECTQYFFKEASLVNGQVGKMHLPFDFNSNSNLDNSQENVSGFSGAGIYSENKYLIGIYTDSLISEHGKGVIIDNHINKFLIKKGFEALKIEDNTQLIRTRVNEEFIDCFEKIEEYQINESIIKLFCLKLDGRKLNSNLLLDRLLENIRFFALSNSENAYYEKEKLSRKRDKHASRKFSKSDSKEKTSDLFIFSFLEADLKAPKLLSKIELDNPFNSVHIKFQDDNTYTLIHSTGSMESDIKKALTNCIEYISSNKADVITPKGLISNSVLSSSYNSNTYKKLEEILIPKKEDFEIEMYNSYGVFVGFNIDLGDLEDLKKGYKSKLHDKIKTIISSIGPDISVELEQKSLQKTEINLYVVPFNDVNSFSEEFIGRL